MEEKNMISAMFNERGTEGEAATWIYMHSFLFYPLLVFVCYIFCFSGLFIAQDIIMVTLDRQFITSLCKHPVS